MSIDFNLDELGQLAQMVEARAKSELSSVLARLQSAAIGEASTLLSEGLSVVSKWEALHAKVQAAASAPAPAEAAPAPDAAPEPSEQDTVALPAVPAPEEAPAQ